MRVSGLVWLACLCSLAASAAGEDHVSLDSDDSAAQDALGESLGAGASYGYFCTPGGQYNPDFAYNDKDCKVDAPQHCGEAWCCEAKAGSYNCPRARRVAEAKCGGQKKPVCEGGGARSSMGGGKPGGCADQHASLCEGVKSYGHCKHTSYAAQCPKSCGSCGVGLADRPSVASILAQAKALDEKKALDRSDDAKEVANAAMHKMHKAVETANLATDSVGHAQETVASAKAELKEAEANMKTEVMRAEDAATRGLDKLEKDTDAEMNDAKKKEAKAERKVAKDRSVDAGMESKLRATETQAGRVGSANVMEAKAALASQQTALSGTEAQVRADKQKKPKGNPELKEAAAAEKKEELKAEAAAASAKAHVSALENSVSDAKARVKGLRDEEADKNPAEAQVIKVTNQLEKSKRKLNRVEEAESVVVQQDKKLKEEVNKDKEVVEEDKADGAAKAKALKAKEALDAVKDGKKDAKKLQKDLEKKFVEKAVLKLKEVSIENSKDEEEKEEEGEDAVYTDATLKTKAEGAFMRATKKIDEIFDDVRPLIRGLDKPAHSKFSTEEEDFINGGPKKGTKGKDGTGFMTPPPPAADSADDEDREDPDVALLSKDMLKDKEASDLARKKLENLKARINDKTAPGAPVPQDVLAAAKEQAKAAADKIAGEEGKKQGKKEAKAAEQAAAAAAAAETAKKVSKDEAKVGKDEDQVEEIESRNVVVAAKVDARKEDVKDLRDDLQTAKKEEKADTVSPQQMESAEAKAEAAQQKLLKAKEDVANAESSKKAAKSAQAAAKKELRSSQAAAEKRAEEKEKDDITLQSKQESGVESAKNALDLAKQKSQEKQRLKEKASRIKNDIAVAKQKAHEDKKEAREEAKAAGDVRQKIQDRLNKARENLSSETKGEVAAARARGEKDVAFKRRHLEEAMAALQKAQRKAEAAGSVAGVNAKVCKQLVPGNSDSKDEASLCGEIKKEGHCNFFDYARYCAKSCGTCLL
jgi:hypothetical protein